MLKDSTPALAKVSLSDLGAVRVQGADGVRFLQGQLSNDVALLTAGSSLLAGLHNPQGRVIALLRLIAAGPDEVLGVLPRELAAPVAARLAKYVLRAKAKVTDASDEWTFSGLTDASSTESESAASVSAARHDERTASLIVPLTGSRFLVATPGNASAATESGATADSHAGNRERWRALDIAAGIPQVYAATSEQFVAQMLNLDVLNAISFTKGCYTGQEVIARAHYRGRVKRRMQRFRTAAPTQLAVGDSGKLRDGRSFRVVDIARLEDRRQEFLAVAPMSHAEEEASDASPALLTASIDAEQLSLPYELPA